MEKHRLALSSLWVSLASLGVLAACGSDPLPPAEYPAVEAPPPVVAEPVAPPPVVEAAPPPPPVQVVAGESTAITGDAPTLKIKSPTSGKVIKTGDVLIKVELKNWTLTADGTHLHLIVDNEPYIAVRDATKPINVSALVRDNLGHELAEGTHVVRLFPGHGHHESVKLASAFASLVFHYKTKTEGFVFDPKAPLLTFSRPKGCVIAGTRVLLDFFVTNTDLTTAGTRVRYTVDGSLTGDITSWAPHYIENLPEGAHALRLFLVNADGSAVPGMFNDTTRTIIVAAECAVPTPVAAPAAPTTPTPTAAPAATAPTPTPAAPPAPDATTPAIPK